MSQTTDHPPRVDHGIPLDQRPQAEAEAITREQGPRTIAPHNAPELIDRDHKGQISGRKGLTPKEAAMADLLAAGVPVGLAGRLAGYADHPSTATRAKKSPAVAARIVELQRARLGRTGAQAIRVIEDILTGAIPAVAATRLDAAKYVLKTNGVELDTEKGKNTKDLRDMTLQELHDIAATFKRQGSGHTEPVRHGDDAQVIEATVESTT